MKDKYAANRAPIDIDHLRSWIGRQDIRYDEVNGTPVRLMRATLDQLAAEEKYAQILPPAWHWLYFLPSEMTLNLARDGHARKGGFLPPIPLSRRMWAGGKLEFLHPVTVGTAIKRISLISDVQCKTGNTGELIFVTVNHDIYCAQRLALRERQDLVYRGAPSENSNPPPCFSAPQEAQWSRTLNPTSAMLFRYSALTFNAHRIHYDKDYASKVDGHSGLVVHGPLLATLLLDLLLQRYPSANILSFDYRAIRPLFAGSEIVLGAALEAPPDRPSSEKGIRVQLWAADAAGCMAMRAQAQILPLRQ